MIPCLEPVLTIRPGAPEAIMRGAKIWQPRMTPPMLTLIMRSHAPSASKIELPGPNSGVVHQHIDRAESGLDAVGQSRQRAALADVGRNRDDVRRRCALGDQGLPRALQRLAVAIGEIDAQPEPSEMTRGGQADARRRAGDDRDGAFDEKQDASKSPEIEGRRQAAQAEQRRRGGGGRTRTYEGLASGFTVRPLCRSGHSPFGARPEAKTPRTSRGAIGPPYLSPAPPCQQLKAAARRGSATLRPIAGAPARSGGAAKSSSRAAASSSSTPPRSPGPAWTQGDGVADRDAPPSAEVELLRLAAPPPDRGRPWRDLPPAAPN